MNRFRFIVGTRGKKEADIVKESWKKRLQHVMAGKSSGIDGLLVTVGLCIIALLLCVVMKDKLEIFIGTIVDALTAKATGILG